jgi:hypothetical protein
MATGAGLAEARRMDYRSLTRHYDTDQIVATVSLCGTSSRSHQDLDS